MIIDSHMHIIVPEILSKGIDDWNPKVYWKNGRQVIEFAGKLINSAIKEFVNIDEILKTQFEVGMDHLVLCPWVSLVRYDAPWEVGLETSRLQNEALVKLAQNNPKHRSVLGTIPLQNPEIAALELEQLMLQPGMKGVEIAASVQGIHLGDDQFEPFWAVAEKTGALVFIHPTTKGFKAETFNEYYLWNAVGNPLETTITAAHMVMAGVMERYKKLKVLLAHGGGTLVALRGRLTHAHSFQPFARSRLQESPEESIKRFYFDSITHNPMLLKNLVDFVGVEHVLLGSDYPFDMGDLNPVKTIRSLNLPLEEEEKVIGGNAAKLLNLEV